MVSITLESHTTLLDQISFFGRLDKDELSLLQECIGYALALTNKTITPYKTIPKTYNYHQTHHNIVFLYHLSRYLYLYSPNNKVSEKVYLLNRMLNSIDLFFKIDMPDNFLIGHGIGTIFSKASYGNYLVVFQNVTIGTQDEKYPTIGEKVVIYPNCVISGNTTIGDNSVIGAGTVLINKDIPPNSIVYFKNGQLCIKENKQNIIQTYFDL